VDALCVRALAEVPVPLLVPRARAVEAEREVELVLLRPQIHAGPSLQAVLEVVLRLEPRAIRQARRIGSRDQHDGDRQDQEEPPHASSLEPGCPFGNWTSGRAG